MQRKRGSDHADWHFFTCITKNRLGADRCTGMYVREEDIFNSIYHQLKLYVDEYFIPVPKYKQQIQKYEEQIKQATQCQHEASENFRLCYEGLVKGEKSIEDLQIARDIANRARTNLDKLVADKVVYEKQYQAFRKLLRASSKELPLSEIMDCIDKIKVDTGKHIVVQWG